MVDNKKQDESPVDSLTPLEEDQKEPQVPPKGPLPKYHKVVDSTYFRIALTGLLILLLFLTAFVIAVISELRRQRAEQFDQGVPPAEVIIPTPEPTTDQASSIDISNWETYTVENCGKLLPKANLTFSMPSLWKSSVEEKEYFAQHIMNGYSGEKLTITCGDGLGGGCDNWEEITLGDKTVPACIGEEGGIIYISNISGSSNGVGFMLDIQYPDTKETENIINQILSTFQFL